MNFIRSLAFATVFALALGTWAQTPNSTSNPPQAFIPTTPDVDGHMQALTEHLNLTADQQAKIRPIVANFLDARQKVLADTGLTDDQRHTRIEAMHEKADHQVRKYLNEDQKKQLTELEQEHHH